jgi:hypothetical protein
MKTSIRIAHAVALLVLIGALQARTPAFVTRAETVEESMSKLSREIIAAYERRDTGALKSFYAK